MIKMLRFLWNIRWDLRELQTLDKSIRKELYDMLGQFKWSDFPEEEARRIQHILWILQQWVYPEYMERMTK